MVGNQHRDAVEHRSARIAQYGVVRSIVVKFVLLLKTLRNAANMQCLVGAVGIENQAHCKRVSSDLLTWSVEILSAFCFSGSESSIGVSMYLA